MKKEFACNGHVVHSADSDDEGDSPAPGKKDEHGRILQFQGDQRASVKQFLVQSGLLSEKEAKDQIVMCVWSCCLGVAFANRTATVTRRPISQAKQRPTYTIRLCATTTLSLVPVVLLFPSRHAFLFARYDGGGIDGHGRSKD